MCGSSSKARAGGEHLVGMNLDHGGALAGVWGGHLVTLLWRSLVFFCYKEEVGCHEQE